MIRMALVFSFVLFYVHSQCQLSDMISVQRKNGRILKTFVAGSPIHFTLYNGNEIEGIIYTIKNDSIFISVYEISAVPTLYGVTRVDTVGVYSSGFHYKNILHIRTNPRQGFSILKPGTLLMVGGAGYFALNAVNSGYLSQPITDHKSIRTLGISLGAFGLGFLLNKEAKLQRSERKKSIIKYVQLR
jgi:hypothetical protein